MRLKSLRRQNARSMALRFLWSAGERPGLYRRFDFDGMFGAAPWASIGRRTSSLSLGNPPGF